jgi:hypothetical protein
MPEPAPVVQIEERQIPVKWPQHQEAAPMANVFHASVTPDGLVLSLGQAVLPVFVGTPEEQQQQARDLAEIEPLVLARVVFTAARAAELLTQIAPLIAVAQAAAAQTEGLPVAQEARS